MRVLVVYAHPNPESFQSALHATALDALRAAGHEVDDCDLYSEGFDPVLSRQELALYHDKTRNREGVSEHVGRLQRSQGLVIVAPTWWFGMPAILKGYFERVWGDGIAFELDRERGRTHPMLHQITRFAVVTTYGSPWWLNNIVIGNPVRKVYLCGVAGCLAPRARKLWLAQYGMDQIGEAERRRFLERVRRQLTDW